ncbi:MAG: glycosyltransferase [Deltaproteobacteria bacterium]|nr:glycosyltransferase [Deltaproteobacteria bacterium]
MARLPKIAIVHDYLNQRGGAERVVAVMHKMFPDAPIYTTIVDYDNLWPELKDADIRPTWMQRLPGIKKYFKKYLMLYPKAIETIKLDGYDIVISSSSAFAKGAKKGADALHVCYCYTPMRFAWDYARYVEREGFGTVTRSALPLLIKRLKAWDVATKDRPDYYVAISNAVKKRIEDFYGTDANVIFPPVDVSRFKISPRPQGYYLIVSRLNPYKKIELAVEAFNKLGLPLKIIGDGPYAGELKRLAKPNIEFLGRFSDADVAGYYSNCRALVFPGEEDFGIAPLEANAAGRPVIAYKAGGALDTVIAGTTGVFFNDATPEALAGAVRRVEDGRDNFDPQKLRAHALKFDTPVFMKRLTSFIMDKYAALNSKGNKTAGHGRG